MKIGILSMQMVDNYGSVLQAYGLKKIMESLGCDVEFIDIKKIESDFKLIANPDTACKEEFAKSSFVQKLLSKHALIRIFNKIKKETLKRKFNEFRLTLLEIEKKSDHYDLCIIGADEVFNCLQPSPWGYTSQLFGNVPEADNVITYAASCGATTYERLPHKVNESIKKSIKNISGFSARDKNTYDFLEKFEASNINQNLDPVLIYDYAKEIDSAVLPSLPDRYCVIYSYGYRFHKKEEVDIILNFCKKHKLTPVAIQGGQTWCQNFMACTPFECLKIFQNSNFVITDTFHGTIFSAKYAERFAVITRNSNYNKLSDLIERLEIKQHLLQNLAQIENVYEINKNQDAIDEILKNERNNTINYLRKYINGTE